MNEANEVPNLVQLPPGNLNPFEQVSTRWDVIVPMGVPPEAMKDPAFWAHRAMKMKPMDEIRARAEDGTWMANLVVLDSSRTWVRVMVVNVTKLTTGDVALTQASADDVKAIATKHKIIHRGPHKWSVVRISDSAVMHQGEAEKENAQAWLEAYARNTVGAPIVAAQQAVPA